LTKDFISGILGEMSPELVSAVQRSYPQIYGACHVDHVRARSTAHRLSAQDSSLLSHLETEAPLRPGRLAKHLGISPSTLSASIKRLAALGYLSRTPAPRDRRQVELRITAQGLEAMADTSVLDRARVEGVLKLLSPRARDQAVSGLELLADAARRFQLRQPNGRNRS
jgi:DNA-binding MarR family transcriptional regulator